MDSGGKFPDSLISCSACKIGKNTQKTYAKGQVMIGLLNPFKL